MFVWLKWIVLNNSLLSPRQPCGCLIKTQPSPALISLRGRGSPFTAAPSISDQSALGDSRGAGENSQLGMGMGSEVIQLTVAVRLAVDGRSGFWGGVMSSYASSCDRQGWVSCSGLA